MESLSLKVDKREKEELGNNASRRMRRDSKIPAVLYGLGKESLSIKVDSKGFTAVIKNKGTANLIFDLSLDKSKKKESVILKDIQRDPITREFLHLDFLRIEMEKEVETQVPVQILNEEIALGIKEEGGVLQHSLREIRVSCLPMDIPESIEYDIKELSIGETVRVEDIKVEGSIKILNDPQEVIVSIIHPSQLIEEEVEEEAEAEEPELIGKEEKETAEEEEKQPESKEQSEQE